MLDQTPTPTQHSLSVRRLVPLGLLAAAAITFIALGGGHYLTFTALAANHEWLMAFVAHWGYAAIVIYTALYAVLTALSVPGGTVLTITGGVLFGTWLGALCALFGATIGATAIFVATRAGLSGLTRRAGPLADRLAAGFGANAFSYLLILRLVPIFPFWLVNLAPALLGIKLRSFVLATFIGIIPGTFVYASLGNGLGHVVANPGLSIVFRPAMFLPIVGFAALALIPIGYRRWRRREIV